MSDRRAEFLAGERPDDVALFLADSSVSGDRLERVGEQVGDGILLVVDGDQGRSAFQAATGVDAMAFAQSAMGLEGEIDDDLSDGTCPEGDDEEHAVEFIFAFAEEQNEDVGGIYADGDVVHAYAQCDCGTTYSDRWTVTDATN